MRKPAHIFSPTRQRGAALLLAMFIIGLAVTAYVVRSYDAAEMKARQDERTMKALAEAKEALIAWSVTHPEFPGAMPYPDRGSGGSYDGESDCFNANNEFKHHFLIGMLPIFDSKDTNCFTSLRKGVSVNFQPANSGMRGKYGERLWYAVSRNLVHNYEFSKDSAKNEKDNIPPIINPGIAIANKDFVQNGVYNPPYLRAKSKGSNSVTGTTPYRWLKVINSNGEVISDRVAVVIMAPGLPITDQDRSADAPRSTEYLDAIGSYSNADYLMDDETFVQAPESSVFNDRLIYITIDELINTLERRVVREVRSLNFTPDMVRCTLIDGCIKESKALQWSSVGVYVTKGDDSAYYHKIDASQNFNCKWSGLQSEMNVDCKTLIPDSRENILRVITPITPSYPFSINKLIGSDAVRVLNKDGIEKGTVGPAENSYFSVSSETTITHLGWPQWYFSNKWDEYIYVVAERFNSNNEGVCSSNCLVLNLRGKEVKEIKQLVFSRAWSNLEKLAKGEATNYFYDVSNLYGDVAWVQ